MQKSDLYKILGIIVGGILILILWPYVNRNDKATDPSINSFEECVEAGNPVMESYPEQCRTEDGKHFVRNIGNYS